MSTGGVFTSIAFRVLAYGLEYSEGIEFSAQGCPSLMARPGPCAIRPVRFAYGSKSACRTPIDCTKPARPCRASFVYTHKDPQRLLRLLAGARISRRGELEIYSVDREFLSAWVAPLTRRMKVSLSISDGHMYLVLEEAPLSRTIDRESGDSQSGHSNGTVSGDSQAPETAYNLQA